MSKLAIKADNLGKCYRIGGKQEKYSTFRDSLANSITAPFYRLASVLRGYGAVSSQHQKNSETENADFEFFWALKNISFEVNRGEVVGIMGRNGAGKSTLLKILTRITDPTLGKAEINGRVASLLEVGTGFHPELTGRENIMLNGSILGMKKVEIESKFDEIISFAEIERFIDTPVKHYSSGMYLRLAFSVAAHLEPEVLFVDEVLAVGDQAFQKKCLGKIEDVSTKGRTILFVSHNLAALATICQKSIVLDQGEIVFMGKTEEGIRHYQKTLFPNRVSSDAHVLFSEPLSSESPNPRITKLEVLDELQNPKSVSFTWDVIIFRIYYYSPENYKKGAFIVGFKDIKDQRLIVLDSGDKFPIRRGHNYIDCLLQKLPLAAGEYFLDVGLANSRSHWLFRETNLATFQVHGKDVFEIDRPPIYSRMVIAAEHEWRKYEEGESRALVNNENTPKRPLE